MKTNKGLIKDSKNGVWCFTAPHSSVLGTVLKLNLHHYPIFSPQLFLSPRPQMCTQRLRIWRWDSPCSPNWRGLGWISMPMISNCNVESALFSIHSIFDMLVSVLLGFVVLQATKTVHETVELVWEQTGMQWSNHRAISLLSNWFGKQWRSFWNSGDFFHVK